MAKCWLWFPICILASFSPVTEIVRTANAAEPLTIAVSSGRYFSGSLHPHTDSDHLCLRTGDGATALLRRVRWEQISSAWLDDRSLTRDELRSLVTRARQESPVLKEDSPVTPLLVPSLASSSSRETVPSFVPSPVVNMPIDEPTPTIRGLSFDASLGGSWGPGINNGLTLVVRPYDNFFHTIPVDGMLEITLIAPQLRDFSAAPEWRGYALQKVGQWSVPIQASQFGVDGLPVQVPIQARYSELNPSVSPYGLVNVRLVVPGSGVFEKSIDGVRLRPFSPIRDLYQSQQGRRMFPFERTNP